MIELTQTDLHFVVSRLPKDIKDLLVKYPELMIAGGFIRATIAGERVSDIDLFGASKESLKSIAQEIALKRKGRLYETDNAITVLTGSRIPLQFITRWLFTDCDKLINSFDYTICQALVARHGDKWVGYCSDMFYPDLAARRLNYTFPQRNEDAGGSALRMRKFISKGYTIQADSMAKVIARLVSNIDFTKLANEKDIAQIIVGLLREVDPLAVIDGIEMVNEHDIQ